MKQKYVIVLIPVDEQGHTPNCPRYGEGEKSASTGATSDAYRNGWDAIFGARKSDGPSLPN